MSNFVIEIQAPTIVAVIEKLIAAIAPRTATPALLPQTPAEQATRQQVVPAPTYVPAPGPAPVAHPPMYSAPVQQYQPGAPANPTPAPQQAAPAMPVAAVPIAPTPLNVQTSAMPAAPVTAYAVPTATQGNPAPVAAAPAYQIDDLARAAAQLMDAGKQQDLIALLGQFGVQTLGQLTPDKFGAFATALRQMGAKF